tara:strand:- start:15 stop:377 length:363 start_codon:yes stop_codon:yes gene_type:complete
MADITITAKSPKTGREVEFVRDFGSSIEEAVELFGADVVLSTFVSQATIRAQGAARTVLNSDDKSADEAIKAGETYTPGVVRKGGGSKKDPFKLLAEKMVSGQLSKDDIMAELEKRLADG